MTFPDTCRHCGERIVTTGHTDAWLPKWTHQPVGAAFQDGQHACCYLTTAEPIEDAP